ncbi:hypothetical protein BM885_005320 [Escherichia coli]|nr:hypothetical protein [Escherichia coli]
MLLGDPAYYNRFGFSNDHGLRYDGPPPEYFMRLAFAEPVPAGAVDYHAAISAR